MTPDSNRKTTPSETGTGIKNGSKTRKHYVPPKPKGSPLTPHASGKWMKKIKGRLFYFGNWGRIENGKMIRLPGDGHAEALALYKAQKEDLYEGRPIATGPDEKLTVKDLCNQFLTAMHRRLQSGKMTHRTFAEYKAAAEAMAECFGKTRTVRSLRPADFANLGHTYRCGVVRLSKEIQLVKTIFNFAVDNELIPKRPNYGTEFKKPDKAERRKHRNAGEKKLFTAAEIRLLLDGGTVRGKDGEPVQVGAASIPMRAMILLGVNCGFGNSDCAHLQKSKVDLKRGVIDFPRPKTGVGRRCFLWPETVEALKAAIKARPKPSLKEDDGCVFITSRGNRYVRDKVTRQAGADENDFAATKVTPINSVGLEFGKRLKALGINGHRGFYALRHTHRTIADGAKDTPAARLIMGHADASIDDVYREHIDDERLEAVAAHVRGWLFGEAVK